MNLGEFEILHLLGQWGPLAATELRDSGFFPEHRNWQGYAGKLVQLEKRGFVRRSDPAAGIWDLTDRARELLAL